MEREILFRGKLSHSGEWATGNLITARNGNLYIIPPTVFESDGHHLIIDSDSPFFVLPETVGQFTGLTDKSGIKIFEGDICRIYFNVGRVSESIYLSLTDVEKNCGIHNFLIESPLFNTQSEFSGDAIEVIGNIHDNPELINNKQ